MSLNRMFVVRLPRVLGVVATCTLLLGLGGVFMCSTYPTYRGLLADCTAENVYEFYSHDTDPKKSARDLTLTNFNNWYASADYTPDGGAASSGNPDAAINYVASAQLTVADPIPDGAWCGATSAAVLRASHNNDWGCLFGPWDFGSNPQDASDWEGIAFWARAPGQTGKGFTLSIGDNNTESGASNGGCHDYLIDGGTSAQTGGGQSGFDPSTGTPLSGSGTTRAPFPDECGNGYTVAMEVTSGWRFYTIPFSEFQQAANPNRVPNSVFNAGTVPGTGLLTSALRHLVIRFPKEAEGELWLAKLAFYRKKAP